MKNLQQAAFMGRIAKALSHNRLHPFHAATKGDTFESVCLYAWNVALCEAFYPLFHTLEIVLRNSLFDTIAAAYPTKSFTDIPCWLDANPSILEIHYGQKAIAKAKKKILINPTGTSATGAVPGPVPPGKLIAELEFGFWTGLLNKYYMYQSASDPRFWPQLLPQAFPYKHPVPKHPSDVSGRLNDIRQFRNRVFHHEPIWRRASLLGDRDRIIEAIAWISPESADIVSKLDRVREVESVVGRRKIRAALHDISRGKP